MAKTNFTKAEEALAAALEKMKIRQLLKEADEKSGKISDETLQKRTQILLELQRGLNKLHAHDKELYKKLKVKRKHLEDYLEHASTLTQEEWKKLLDFKEQVDSFVKKVPQGVSDDEIVSQQREVHINKRFNVSEKWLPLK